MRGTRRSGGVTFAEALRAGDRRLAAAGIDNPRLESRLLLAHATGLTSEALLRDLTVDTDFAIFDRLVTRRAAREPLAFIIGWREFWSLPFQVSPATLIPRPDSETLVEAALALCPDRSGPYRVLDLGTGTGCLLLAFLSERPCAHGIGVDLSMSAAVLAGRNALALGFAARAAFFHGHWADAISGRFDLVLSNPPYIPTSDLDTLMPDVICHEPRTALDGGTEGLAAYRTIFASLRQLLGASGVAILELGAGQYGAVAALSHAAGFHSEPRLDLSGTPRAIILRLTPEKTHWHHHVTGIV